MDMPYDKQNFNRNNYYGGGDRNMEKKQWNDNNWKQDNRPDEVKTERQEQGNTIIEHLEWRSTAMMRVFPNLKDKKIGYSFMLGNKDSRDYNKDSKIMFSTDESETYQLIKYLENVIEHDGAVRQFTLVHSPNNPNKEKVVKTLYIVSKPGGKDEDDVFTAYFSLIVKTNDVETKYVISFNKKTLSFFLFKLKLMYYYLVTGSFVGFSENFI